MLKKIKRMLYRCLDTKDINYEIAQDLIKKNENIYLIDVRTKQEYNEGHLPGAINICSYDIENEINRIKKDSCIILYCTSGTRSKNVKEKLEKFGYLNVYNLKGGIEKIKD